MIRHLAPWAALVAVSVVGPGCGGTLSKSGHPCELALTDRYNLANCRTRIDDPYDVRDKRAHAGLLARAEAARCYEALPSLHLARDGELAICRRTAALLGGATRAKTGPYAAWHYLELEDDVPPDWDKAVQILSAICARRDQGYENEEASAACGMLDDARPPGHRGWVTAEVAALRDGGRDAREAGAAFPEAIARLDAELRASPAPSSSHLFEVAAGLAERLPEAERADAARALDERARTITSAHRARASEHQTWYTATDLVRRLRPHVTSVEVLALVDGLRADGAAWHTKEAERHLAGGRAAAASLHAGVARALAGRELVVTPAWSLDAFASRRVVATRGDCAWMHPPATNTAKGPTLELTIDWRRCDSRETQESTRKSGSYMRTVWETKRVYKPVWVPSTTPCTGYGCREGAWTMQLVDEDVKRQVPTEFWYTELTRTITTEVEAAVTLRLADRTWTETFTSRPAPVADRQTQRDGSPTIDGARSGETLESHRARANADLQAWLDRVEGELRKERRARLLADARRHRELGQHDQADELDLHALMLGATLGVGDADWSPRYGLDAQRARAAMGGFLSLPALP